jgi:dienelactone hydrolase
MAKHRLCRAIALLSLCAVTPALAQTFESNPLALEPGAHAVGFRLLQSEDRSRLVTGGTGSRVHPRPVRTYLWYPAQGTSPAMRFGRYVSLADGDVWPAEIVGSTVETMRFSRRPLARSLTPGAYAALLQQPVLASENATPLPGPFPLIVVGQGLYYESPISFAMTAEYLAARGFVVATAPLVGTNSPIVRLDVPGLETQVRDLEFVIAKARELPFVSRNALGVLGFDMGGMAGVLLAMRNPDVDAFVSLDSGIVMDHPSGLPKVSPGYDPLALRVPWLAGMRAMGMGMARNSQTPSLLETAVHADRYVLLLPDAMGHEGFTTEGLVPGRRAVAGYWPAATAAGAEGHRVARQYVSNFFAAFLGHDAKSRAFLSEPPATASSGSKVMLERRAAVPVSITYDELVQSIVAGRASDAMTRLRSLATADPNHVLLKESSLLRLIASLQFTWALTKEIRPVIEFTIERYPASAGAREMLAALESP